VGGYSRVVWVVTSVQDDADGFYIFSIFLSVVSWMAVVKCFVMGAGLLAFSMNVFLLCYILLCDLVSLLTELGVCAVYVVLSG
jgi:hypothetical protein